MVEILISPEFIPAGIPNFNKLPATSWLKVKYLGDIVNNGLL